MQIAPAGLIFVSMRTTDQVARDPLWGRLFENFIVKAMKDRLKAGTTINRNYFKDLKTFAALHPQALSGGIAIFGGSEGQSPSDWLFNSWQQLLRK